MKYVGSKDKNIYTDLIHECRAGGNYAEVWRKRIKKNVS